MNIFKLLSARVDVNRKAMRNHLREFIRDAAAAQIDGHDFELLEHELDMLTSLLDAEGLEPADFEANVIAHVKRIRQADLASQAPSLKAEAERLDAEAKAFGEENLRRYREGLATHREMEIAASAALPKYLAAVTAIGDLQAAGEISDEERAATEEKAIVVEKIGALRDRLSPVRPWHMGPNFAASVSELPVIAMNDARNEISARNKSARPDSPVNVDAIRRCQRIIEAAEEAIRKIELEIAKLTKQGEAIDFRLREFALDRPFVILRQARSHANSN